MLPKPNNKISNTFLAQLRSFEEQINTWVDDTFSPELSITQREASLDIINRHLRNSQKEPIDTRYVNNLAHIKSVVTTSIWSASSEERRKS